MNGIELLQSLIAARPERGWKERSQSCAGAAFLWFHAWYVGSSLSHAAGGRSPHYTVERVDDDELLAWLDPNWPPVRLSAPVLDVGGRLQSFAWDGVPVDSRLLELSDSERDVHALLACGTGIAVILMTDSLWCDWDVRGARTAQHQALESMLFTASGQVNQIADYDAPFVTRFRDGRIAVSHDLLSVERERTGLGVIPKAIPVSLFQQITSWRVDISRKGTYDLSRCAVGEVQALIDGETIR